MRELRSRDSRALQKGVFVQFGACPTRGSRGAIGNGRTSTRGCSISLQPPSKQPPLEPGVSVLDRGSGEPELHGGVAAVSVVRPSDDAMRLKVYQARLVPVYDARPSVTRSRRRRPVDSAHGADDEDDRRENQRGRRRRRRHGLLRYRTTTEQRRRRRRPLQHRSPVGEAGDHEARQRDGDLARQG